MERLMADELDPKHVFSEAETAIILGITKRMLAKRRYDGKIGYVKDGHFIGYLHDQIIEYCEQYRRGHRLAAVPLTTEGMIEALRKRIKKGKASP
jgi:hypothetical protein